MIEAVRIALTADPEIPVPPRLYGGIERIIDMLARELAARGNEVTLFAHAGSVTAARLVPWPGRSSLSVRHTARNAAMLAREVLTGRFDLVHSFSRIAYLLPLLPLPLPKLMTYQREVTPRSVRLGHRLSRGTLHFSAISRHMMEDVKGLGQWHVVYNGVPMDVYDLVPAVVPDAPLVFLGRIEQIKGAHLAIEVARRTGRRLVIAGNVPEGHEDYFEREVRPHLNREKISYVGPVDDRQKNALLGSAAAFLMPILWEEPFGIVMAEALACGTPVIGLRRGSVPEIVEDGVTGFVCDSVEDLTVAVGRIRSIDRTACRERARRLFSETAVVEGYLGVYGEMLAARAAY